MLNQLELAPAEPGVSADASTQAKGKNGTVAALLRRAGWDQAMDESTGKVYYYKPATGETRWERPGLRELHTAIKKGMPACFAAIHAALVR